MPPVYGRRPAPLDRHTPVGEPRAVLAERLSQVEIYGGKCACRNAEARPFLAKLRRMLEAIDRGEVT